LRRETLLQQDFGKARLGSSLECVEHLVNYLALLSMVQMTPAGTGGALQIARRFQAAAQPESFHLDWGLCLAVLQDGVAFTKKNAKPLDLAFPGLLDLVPILDDQEFPWRRAEQEMRKFRNSQAHLERFPEPEVARLAGKHHENLEEVFRGVGFLTSIPLVYAEDYRMDPAGNRRYATFQVLQGVSTAFRREVREVGGELPRGAVGVLDSAGHFRSLYPWMIREICPLCKRLEVFVFSRLENKTVTYVAMESGHSHQKPELLSIWLEILSDE